MWAIHIPNMGSECCINESEKDLKELDVWYLGPPLTNDYQNRH